MRITAEEKAIDLVKKFVIKHNRWSENEYTLSKTIPELKKELFNTQWFAPKEMAVMCVDEIIKSIKKDSDFTTTYEASKKYWNEVRECIAAF